MVSPDSSLLTFSSSFCELFRTCCRGDTVQHAREPIGVFEDLARPKLIVRLVLEDRGERWQVLFEYRLCRLRRHVLHCGVERLTTPDSSHGRITCEEMFVDAGQLDVCVCDAIACRSKHCTSIGRASIYSPVSPGLATSVSAASFSVAAGAGATRRISPAQRLIVRSS